MPRISGRSAMLTTGALWSLFLVVLWMQGHGPSRTLIPIASGQYYLFEALLMLPVVVVMHTAMTAVAHRIAGGAEVAQTANACGYAWSVATITCFLGPDVVAYSLSGFSSLVMLVRVTIPLTGVVMVAVLAVMLASVHRVAWRRAVGASLAAVVVQAAISAPILR